MWQVFWHNVRSCYVNKIMHGKKNLPGKVPVDKNVDNVKNFAAQGEIHISTLLSTVAIHSHLAGKSYKPVTTQEITSTAQPGYCQLFLLKKCQKVIISAQFRIYKLRFRGKCRNPDRIKLLSREILTSTQAGVCAQQRALEEQWICREKWKLPESTRRS